MRNHYTLLETVMILGCLLGYEAQAAPFQNLDFESANLPVIPRGQYGSLVPASEGIPGWTAFLGTNVLPQVLHNSVTLGSPAILILGPDWPYGLGGRIEGRFTAALFAGSASSGPPLSISQTGLVPVDGRWLLFKARVGPTPTGVFAVSLNDQDISMTVLAAYPDFTVYGGDISAFAGSEAALKFTVFRGLGNYLDLDSMVFAVPEPGTVVVAGIGLWLLALRLACRRRARSKPANP